MVHDCLHTRLCEIFGIEKPILAFTHDLGVAVAVARAGGLPVYGATRETPDEIAKGVDEFREHLGDRPFGIDLVLPRQMPERNDRKEIEAQLPARHVAFVEDIVEKYNIPAARPGQPSRSRFVRSNEMAKQQLDVVVAKRPALLACGMDSPPDVVARAHAAGIKVLGLVGNVKGARRVADAGVDLIVAQGYDSAAHTGEIGTFSLVPQVARAVLPVPVLAAGGVVSGEHLAAALCLGAVGVWCGTLWLGSAESTMHPAMKAKLFEASASDTVRTRSMSGKPNRQLRTEWTRLWDDPANPDPLPMPYHDILVGDALAAIHELHIDPLWGSAAGQGVGLITRERPVAEIIEEISSGARDILMRLTGAIQTRA